MTWAAIVIGLLTTLIGGAGIGGMLKTWLDHRRAARSQTDEVALTLVGKLEGRIESVEAEQRQERARCEAQLAALRHRVNMLTL